MNYNNYDEFDFANNDFMPIIRKMNEMSVEEKATVVFSIKNQMAEILKHFISCTWGAHYNTMFKELIIPFLDDEILLDSILRTNIIKDKSNVLFGKTGAKIYPELLSYLSRVHSPKVRKYLKKEF
jgi:hypothetical protein